MSKLTWRDRCLTITLLSSTALALPAASADDAVEEEAITIEVVEVTGTRIKRPGLKSNSPITTLGKEELKFKGTVNIENALNQLPQITPDANENVSNGSDGSAQINLRDLGSNRNLVLIDGQRMSSNVNFVPSFMVERVDVVSGGASSVYGSDAMSGVVNFILNKELEGIRIDAQYSINNHTNNNKFMRDLVASHGYDIPKKTLWDGGKIDVNIAFGSDLSDGRGNVTAYAGYRETDPIQQDARDVSSCPLWQVYDDSAKAYNSLMCGGSGNNEFGVFIPREGPNANHQFVNTRDGNKTWTDYDNSFRYNYAPLNYFQRKDERWTFGAFANYELFENMEVYGSVMFMDDKSVSQVAPSALWWGSDFAINCDNPYMSDDIGTKLCGSDYGTDKVIPTYIGYRPVAAPAQGRIGDIHYSDYRVTGGVRGDIAEGISYDVNVLHWSTDYNFLYKNDIDQNRAAAALLAVEDSSGNVVCKNSTYGSCVPADVFGYGKLSAEALDFMYGTTFTNTQVSQSVYSGVISSDLTSYDIVSPWAETGVGFVIGAEYRKDGTQTRYDEVLIQANNTPVPPSTIKAFEVFAELEVPVIEDMPLFESLTFNAGYRISDYKASQEGIAETSDYSAHTYKVELDWSPIPDVRFRASYNHALRAPNIGELFGAVGLGNVSGQDPCSGANPTASLAICKLTGVTDAMYGNISECPADVCVARSGGNVALKPEEADTYTVGIVLTPQFLPGLTLTADYYDIKITGYIDSIDATSIMNQCVQGNEYFCKLFHRAPGSGILFGTEGWIESSLQNSGFLRTKGFDIGGTYSFDTESAGSFTATLNGTYMTSWEKEEIVGLPTFDCAGLFGPGCGQPAPKWRHNARVTWTDPWGVGSLSLAWRYIGATTLTFNEDDQFLGGEKYNVNDRIDAYSYIDLSGSAPINDNIDVRFGINNLFDKSAPAIAAGLLAEFGNGNTYPGVYSVMGRNIFVGLTANF